MNRNVNININNDRIKVNIFAGVKVKLPTEFRLFSQALSEGATDA
jgi:hypothetical protein